MYNPDASLLGRPWFNAFCNRNPNISSQVGRKFPRCRDEHCTTPAFEKMFNQFERFLLESGNAVKFPEPVHMDRRGRIVEDEKDGYGRKVPIDITRPQNVFVYDETGDNTHGKDDSNNGGEKVVVPAGVIPKQLVSIKNAHFTVVPVNNLLGELVFVTLIFKGDKLLPVLTMGVDVFAEWITGDDHLQNFGMGKRYPGLVLYDKNGKEIPVMFAATPNASMTGSILRDMYAKMDELGITQRGEDAHGKYYPMSMGDGHISRMDEDFLEYINNPLTLWAAILGAVYGTNFWQFHDSSQMNGGFKSILPKCKEELIKKKRLAGLNPKIEPVKIVIVVREAII